MSGLGCYRLADSTDTEEYSCSVYEMFGLSEKDSAKRRPSHVVKYHHDGSIVKLRLVNVLPKAEMNFVKLYSWPCRYSKFPADSHRVMNTDIFENISLILNNTSVQFKEEQ